MRMQTGVLLALIMSGASHHSSADEQELKQCQAIKDRLQRLEALRADGGSAKKMDAWKRQIHQQQDEYSRLYCRRYRWKLNGR
jgi:hypothetical protein